MLLFWGALFAPAILRSEVLFEGEIREVHFPFDAVALEQIAEGRAPLWTPRVFMGYPLLANVETALLYPLHLPILALGAPERMITWALALAFLMGGLFAYGCARAFGQRPTAAAACGLAYMLSGYWLNAFTSLHTIFTNAWQPACLWAVRAYWRAPSGPRAAAVSGAVAMTALGGHLQNAFVGLFFLALYAAFEWVRRRREPGARAHAARLLT
ncbi:MAG: hypothetical protein K8I02_09130, partial [Candidatus Methylomirabilis sp.]|nr:hypothetical protein [Deltaproteobacteria bacterium]